MSAAMRSVYMLLPHAYTPPTPPAVSECGRWVACSHGSSVVVRLVVLGAVEHTVEMPSGHLTQLAWEPVLPRRASTKLAAVVGDKVVVCDLRLVNRDRTGSGALTTIHDPADGVLWVLWVPPRPGHNDTAYTGARQVVVFSANGLKATVYLLDALAAVQVLDFPKFRLVVARPFSVCWLVVVRHSTSDVAVHMANAGSSSVELAKTNLQGDHRAPVWSPTGRWVVYVARVLQGVHMDVYNSAGVGAGEPLVRIRLWGRLHPGPTLGVSRVCWSTSSEGDELVVAGSMEETLHVFNIDRSTVEHHLGHPLELGRQTGMHIWRLQLGAFVRQATPTELPHRRLALHLRGVHRLAAHPTQPLVAATVKSMPETVVVYNRSGAECVVVALLAVRSVEWHAVHAVLLVATESHILAVAQDGEWVPLVVRACAELPRLCVLVPGSGITACIAFQLLFELVEVLAAAAPEDTTHTLTGILKRRHGGSAAHLASDTASDDTFQVRKQARVDR